MSLELAHQRLGWPRPEEVRSPSGEGARIFAELAKDKIGRPISQLLEHSDLKIGVLTPNSESDSTEAPLAIVAEFSGQATDKALRELHRLSWNFSHSPTLVTIESDLLRVWTCCEPPDKDRPLQNYVVQDVPIRDLKRREHTDIAEEAARVLHWVNLVSGQFFRERPERFRRDQRADQSLLTNLHHVRQVLRDDGLNDDDVCHDLLARIIFVQFLFDRKDQNGRSALNESRLASLQEAGILRDRHKDLPEILSDYDETYRLFDWLNSRFNGDLFPGKGNTPIEREQAWRQEKANVKSRHLQLLREFIKGDLEMTTGQRCLWPQYSFDAIPLEFISSIYESFVTKRARSEGIYYTPPHLVDFILDRVLPWNSEQWDLKILDPACGSGVFLVKAFQRLIHRWKRANPKEDIRAETLRGLLERNLFGVDKDPHAVRVAAFSLYLAMCDEIDPKHYWTQIHFPPMRAHRLINADFFEEHRAGFRTNEDEASYDIVIGNAPWGEKLLTEAAITWADDQNHKWPVVNKGIGTLFLTKAAALTQAEGKVAMIQSASSLLFNRSGPACAFRKQFFTTFGVKEVVNLSALRFRVFNQKTHSARKSVAPSCVIIFEPQLRSDEKISYVSPKEVEILPDDFNIVIEPQDRRGISPYDASQHPEAWTTMMWGGPRDYAFIRRLQGETNLEKLKSQGKIVTREGLIPSPSGKLHPDTEKRFFWEGKTFPDSTFLFLETSPVMRSQGIKTHRKTALESFDLPQLVLKQGWQEGPGRFAAAITPELLEEGVLFNQSYLTAHLTGDDTNILDAACLSYNSILAVYFLLLTSSRFGPYRPEPLVEELLRVPVPDAQPGLLDGLLNSEDIDRRIRKAFSFKDAEWVLVEDLFNVTLPDRSGDSKSLGRQHTHRTNGSMAEPELRTYCEYFTRVLKAGFGEDKQITATVFQERAGSKHLPYRLVAFELNHASDERFQLRSLDVGDLLTELEVLNQTWLSSLEKASGSIYQQRVARIYDYRRGVPTVFILKPDAYRYWTRSMGLHDADEVAADFARWQLAARV
jgi:hypothetical protein